jgi:hypothetical protein
VRTPARRPLLALPAYAKLRENLNQCDCGADDGHRLVPAVLSRRAVAWSAVLVTAGLACGKQHNAGVAVSRRVYAPARSQQITRSTASAWQTRARRSSLYASDRAGAPATGRQSGGSGARPIRPSKSYGSQPRRPGQAATAPAPEPVSCGAPSPASPSSSRNQPVHRQRHQAPRPPHLTMRTHQRVQGQRPRGPSPAARAAARHRGHRGRRRRAAGTRPGG